MNQAIGRVIRHKNDWGAVFLCDSRFKQPNVKNEISDWVKAGNGLKEFDNFPSALIETMNFFKAKPKTAGNPKKKMLAASSSSLASRQVSHQSEQPTHNSKKVPLKKPFTVPSAEQVKRSANQETSNGNPFERVSLNGQKQMKMTDFKTTKISINKPDGLSSIIEQPIYDNEPEDTQFLRDIQQQGQQQQQQQLFSVEREHSENSCGAFDKQFMKSEEGASQTSAILEESKTEKQPPKSTLSNLRKVQSKNIQNLILKQNQLRKEEEEKQQVSQDRIFLKSKGTTTASSEINSQKPLLSKDSSFDDDEKQDNLKTVETNHQYPSDLLENEEFNQEPNNQNMNPYLYQKQGQGNINLFGQSHGQDQLERTNYFNPKPKVNLEIGKNYMHTPRSSLLKSPYQRDKNNSNDQDFLFSENSNSGQLGQYGNSNNFRDQQKEQQQQSFGDNSRDQPQYQVYPYTPNKPLVPYSAKSLGVQRQGPSLSGLQKQTYSMDKQSSSNPKANEPCYICKRIPAERVMNKNCDHIGCLSCFMKNKACSCGEKCTRKDLEIV